MEKNELPGFNDSIQQPLFNCIFNRRTHRVSKGVKSVPAGSLTYTSDQKPQPLSPLEEAMLIAVTGATGITMPDRPFETEDGEKILGTPNIKMGGRAAGSPDNAQGTHFFLINDSGTYFIKRLDNKNADLSFTPENLIARAEKSKHLISEKRLEFPRQFPYYLDSNRFLSNLEGTTILLPIVDITRQYINGIMYLLTQRDGHRPSILDDRNFYRPAGVKKWIRNGFLNKNIPLTLGLLGTLRTELEAMLLLQNIFLTTEAIGLGGWIHASFASPFLFGSPAFSEMNKGNKGLGFRYETPRFCLMDILRWGNPFPKYRANPVGLDGVIEGMCPPYYKNMSEAVDALIEIKYGKNGVYSNPETFKSIFKDDYGEKYIKEVPKFEKKTIQCTKDICNYIYDTHGRFPAHVDAMYVPGVWIQVHHIDLKYYDKLFNGGYSDTHKKHQELWHNHK